MVFSIQPASYARYANGLAYTYGKFNKLNMISKQYFMISSCFCAYAYFNMLLHKYRKGVLVIELAAYEEREILPINLRNCLVAEYS